MSGNHVCPWWLAYTFDNPLRRLIQNPGKMFGEYVAEGMIVLDVGCGMGYFSLGLARIVGDTGKVIGVDLQQKMLDVMQKRAFKAGLAHRIMPHLCEADNLNLNIPVDFALAFWMVHETPDPENFFRQIVSILKPEGKLLYTEPSFHVPAKLFEEICGIAQKTGLKKINDLNIAFSRAVLFAPK
jgi:ubiquinone/menaquinone biosynthesis C-methylase UbiE